MTISIRVVLRGTACAAAAMLAAGCMTSGPSVSDIERTFIIGAATWDLNKDGTVTCQEWKTYAGEMFDRADTGRQGFLTPEQFKRIEAEDKLFTVADFKYFDSGNKGRVTRADMVDKPNPAFVMLDQDKSCSLTSAELAGSRTQLQPSIASSDADAKNRMPGEKTRR